MAWRLARSLEHLRAQINALAPKRSKASDGTIGNAEHAARTSDHNPWVRDGATGVVTAIDFTNDPGGGLPSQHLADALVAARDERIKYIISNGRIVSGTGQKQKAWAWRPYSGKNKHDHHVHISVKSSKAQYDRADDWNLSALGKPAKPVAASPAPTQPRVVPAPEPVQRRPTPVPAAPVVPDPVTVRIIQELLREKGYVEVGPSDGDAGDWTAAAIMAFQRENGIDPTGLITPELQKQLAAAPKRAAPAADTPRSEIRATVPEVRTNWLTRMGALVLGAPAAVLGLADGVLGKIDTARSYITPLQEMFADVPGWAWLAGLALVAAVLYYVAKHGEDAGVHAFRQGARR